MVDSEDLAVRRGLSDGFADFEDDVFGDEQPSREDIFHGSVKSPSGGWDGEVRHGIWMLAGHGERTSERCGTFRRFMGCSRGELHRQRKLGKDGRVVSYEGKAYVFPVFHSCDKPSCPVCYERGWAIREAGNMEIRLLEASLRQGEVVHAIVACPSKLYPMAERDPEGLRRILLGVLRSRGIVGGAIVFHSHRYASKEESERRGVSFGWRFSCHFHVFGFVFGGYKCRGCPKCRRGCGGFVDKNYRLNEKDGWYVKVKAKRKTVFGSCWYAIHHCGVRTDKKRYHPVVWFGTCSYRALKVSEKMMAEYEKEHKKKCPICGMPLVKHEYLGRNKDVIALFHRTRGSRESVRGFYDRIEDWAEVTERGSGSYER